MQFKRNLDRNKIKFLLLEGIHEKAISQLHDAGYTNIITAPKALSDDELLTAIEDAYYIGIRSNTKLTKEVLANAKKLRAIGCFCIGTNQVDLVAARQKGIPVFNAPYSNTRSVAELVIAEMIILMRGITEKNAAAHRGQWLKMAKNSFEVRGKTLGIIGYGTIGSQISVLAESLGVHVIFYDIESKLPLGNAVQVKTLNELLAKSDVVSLHVPADQSTHNLISYEEIAQMKDNACLINAARGTVVNIDALLEGLKSKKIKGAAIDVFPTEPKSNNDPFISPLTEFDNVILTPHVGGSTMEAQENIGIEVINKLIKYSENGTTLSSVNFPSVALPSYEKRFRIIHIHQNVPGMLAEINKILSQENVNVCAQYLQTMKDVGYVVMDINKELSVNAIETLRNIPGTIRTRIMF